MSRQAIDNVANAFRKLSIRDKRPYTRRVRQYQSKKKYQRRQANRQFYGDAQKMTIMPNKYLFHTRYCDLYKTINATPGAQTQYVFTANGLYDPDNTGGGHQAIGFDQMMLFYDHYTVIGAKIKVQIQNESDQHPVIVAVSTSDDMSSASSSIQTLIENGGIKWKRLERQGSDGNFINNMRSSCTFTKTLNIKKFLGRPSILSDDECRGTITTNPVEGVFFKVHCQGIDQSADAVLVSFSTQIDFVAILTEPKPVQAS